MRMSRHGVKNGKQKLVRSFYWLTHLGLFLTCFGETSAHDVQGENPWADPACAGRPVLLCSELKKKEHRFESVKLHDMLRQHLSGTKKRHCKYLMYCIFPCLEAPRSRQAVTVPELDL